MYSKQLTSRELPAQSSVCHSYGLSCTSVSQPVLAYQLMFGVFSTQATGQSIALEANLKKQ